MTQIVGINRLLIEAAAELAPDSVSVGSGDDELAEAAAATLRRTAARVPA